MKPQVKSIYHSLVLGIVISLFLICSPASADFTWDGGTDANDYTSTAVNWVLDAAPGAGISERLIFGATAADNLVDVNTTFTALTGIDFTLADAEYAIGNAGGGDLGFGAGATITNTTVYTHVISSTMTSAGLTFNLDNNLTVSGVISGTTITKSGDGTLSLGGNNDYSGATAIDAGTLAVTVNNALGTVVGSTTVASGATLDFQNVTYATAEALTVNGGTISTSAGTSSFAGDVTLGADSTISVAGVQLTLSGVIGDGGNTFGLTKTGAGIAVLSGENTYTGGTTINVGTLTLGAADRLADTGAVTVNGGTLILGGAETIGTLSGTGGLIDIGANALTVTQGADLTYAGVIGGGGIGTLTKAGASTLTLSGDNTYTGLTTVTAGTLNLTGEVLGGVTVGTAGTLVGTGTVGDAPGDNLTLNGTFAPGSSGIGTMTIEGNYLQNAAGTLEIEVSKTGGADFLDVTGSATFIAGTTINVFDITPTGSLIVTGDTFNIIEADGGVVDGGPTITDNSAVLSFAGLVSGNFYQLVAARQAFATAVGRAGGPLGAIDSDIANATGDYITLINALTALNSAQLSDAAEQLDPLPHAASTTISLRTNQRMAGNLANYLSARRSGIERLMTLNTQSREHQLLIADASNDPRMLAYVISENKRIARMQQNEVDSKIRGFFRPFGVFYEHDSTSKMTGFRAKAVGAQFGFDKNFRPDLLMGIGGGYSHSFIDFKEGRGEGEADSFRVGPYASYFKDNYFIDASASFGYHNNENERDIRFGTINRTADSDYHAWDLSAYIGGGYDFPVKDWTVTPTTSLQYIRYRSESFKETGAGAAGLNVDAATSQSLRGKLGVTLSTVTELYGTKIVPELFAGWAHEFIDDEDIKARFAQGTAKFTTDVADDWDDSVYFGAGLSALLKENISAFVRYEGEYSTGDIGDIGIEALSVGITVLF